jgi:alkaline phosphatase
MLNKKIVAAGVALFACLFAASLSLAGPVLVTLPIDRAKFLAGQKFDLEVELRGARADEITVRLNGRNAADVFGAAPC